MKCIFQYQKVQLKGYQKALEGIIFEVEIEQNDDIFRANLSKQFKI